MHGVAQPAFGIPLPSLIFQAEEPHAVEGYPTPRICLALQFHCSLLGHIGLPPPVFIETSCRYTGSLTGENLSECLWSSSKVFVLGFRTRS